MRFGYCTGFAAGMTGSINYNTLKLIESAGYDYVEFPLMQLVDLTKEEFIELKTYLDTTSLSCDACCNMFPARVRLLGKEASETVISEYLNIAFPRMAALGTKTIVLGSSAARKLPEDMSKEEGVHQLARLISRKIVPLLEKYNMTMVIEPIGSYEANFINTLPDGMEIVHAVSNPHVQLLADSVHMLYEHEPAAHIKQYAPYLKHIHLCENERALPAQGISDELREILIAIVQSGYNGTISFEPMPHTLLQMQDALSNIKSILS
ncbi:MAG: sugar phosphate isomerase/epimerase family protein [Christensenellales bacterium]|jgi:D-psicose/D-tagatose/L-ribulose 3-epimerase